LSEGGGKFFGGHIGYEGGGEHIVIAAVDYFKKRIALEFFITS